SGGRRAATASRISLGHCSGGSGAMRGSPNGPPSNVSDVADFGELHYHTVMATAGPAAHMQAVGRDHAFHPLRVARVVRETADASSFVLEVPRELEQAFAYRAGQFVTHRVRIDGQSYLRSYSMSSSPDVDEALQ